MKASIIARLTSASTTFTLQRPVTGPIAHVPLYVVLALVMLIRGFSDAIMMRSQLALAAGTATGFLPPEHYDQIFSAHGTIMSFFVAMAFVIGLMNFVVPLQLGVRDVAFPLLNSVSFWLTAPAGVLLVNMSLMVSEFARTGWLAYPPLSELQFSPGVGVGYYLWSLQISRLGTLLAGINLTTTILKLRAPAGGTKHHSIRTCVFQPFVTLNSGGGGIVAFHSTKKRCVFLDLKPAAA